MITRLNTSIQVQNQQQQHAIEQKTEPLSSLFVGKTTYLLPKTEQRNRKTNRRTPYRENQAAKNHACQSQISQSKQTYYSEKHTAVLTTKSQPCLIKHYLHAPLFYNRQLGHIKHTGLNLGYVTITDIQKNGVAHHVPLHHSIVCKIKILQLSFCNLYAARKTYEHATARHYNARLKSNLLNRIAALYDICSGRQSRNILFIT